MTDEVKSEVEEVVETPAEEQQPSYIEQIAAKMSRENRYKSFFKEDVGTMPALAKDEDNAAKQNAEKKNAPGEKAVPAGPTEVKGASGQTSARKADKIQQDPDNKKAYDAMGVKLGEEADLDESASYAATQNAKAHAKKDGANYNDQSVAHKYNALHMKKAGFTHFKNTRMGGREYNKMGVGTKIGPEHHKGISEAPDLDADNSAKAIKHDCASHVVHKEHGEGRCIPGMHTLEENGDGTGYVTHYDVMFNGEEGPYIVEDCPVEDLEITQESNHGHMRKKKSKLGEMKVVSETIHARDFPKGHKPHPAVVKHAKSYHASAVDHEHHKDGHSVQSHGGDEYMSFHHIDDKGKHKGRFHYDHETRGGAGAALKKDIKKALPNSPDHVHTAIHKAISNAVGD